jgi:hypothetical protein
LAFLDIAGPGFRVWDRQRDSGIGSLEFWELLGVVVVTVHPEEEVEYFHFALC